MEACKYCARYDHNQWNCAVKRREDEQRRLEKQYQSQMENEARATRQAVERAEREQRVRRSEDDRHHRRVEAEAAAARLAAERAEEIERARHEQQREHEKRYEESANKLHEIKRRAGVLRRSRAADPTRAWLEWRLLLAEARLLSPAHFHPAQQSEFTDGQSLATPFAPPVEATMSGLNVQAWVRRQGPLARRQRPLARRRRPLTRRQGPLARRQSPLGTHKGARATRDSGSLGR